MSTDEANFAAENQTKLTANIKAAGCAAKISAHQLSEIVRGLPQFASGNLLTSISTFEDAAVYKITDELAIIQTIDFFPPVVDDPFLYGKIAAVNALSDVYAMGGRPVLALNILGFPVCDYPLSVAQQIVQGGAAALQEAGALLAGGHSIQTTEPLYGLSVMGTIHPDKILRNDGAKANDEIVLAKALGTGIGLLAYKGAVLTRASADQLFASLTQLNAKALEVALDFSIHAATDVTGFGLIGHLHEMARGAGSIAAHVSASDLPLLSEALSCAEQGLVPAAAYANRKSYESICDIDESLDVALADILFDPQTSGGLLLAVEKGQGKKLADKLKSAGYSAAHIGNFVEGKSGHVEIVR